MEEERKEARRKFMKVDEETRYIMATKLNLTNEDIERFEKGLLSLSHMDNKIIASTKLSRKIGKEMEDIAPILDKCDVFNANKMLINISYKIGGMHEKGRLLFDDRMELMTKLEEYNTAGKMICECKHKVPRTWK